MNAVVHRAIPGLKRNSSIYPAKNVELDDASIPITTDAVERFAVIAVVVPREVPPTYSVVVDPLRTIAT